MSVGSIEQIIYGVYHGRIGLPGNRNFSGVLLSIYTCMYFWQWGFFIVLWLNKLYEV